MHFAPAGYVEGIGALLGDVQGHVLEKLLFQPIPEVPGGDKLALLAGKGRVIDGEGHFNGGIGNLHEGQRLHAVRGTQGTADGDVRHAGQGDDFAGVGFGDGVLGQAVELIQGNHLAPLLDLGIVVVADGDFLIDLDSAPLHTTHGDPAYIFIVVDGGNQQL